MSTQFNPVQIYTVTEDYSGTRLDNCLLSKMKGIPRSKIYSIIRKGEVRVNKSRCRPSQKLQIGDEVRIPPYSNEHKATKKAENNLKDKPLIGFVGAPWTLLLYMLNKGSPKNNFDFNLIH